MNECGQHKCAMSNLERIRPVAVYIATIHVHLCTQFSYNLSHYSPKYMQYWLSYGSIIDQDCVCLITATVTLAVA
jgi:hypothetical protein